MSQAIAEHRPPPQWLVALWASSCLHMILVGALQPAPPPIADRFSQRAIELTVETAAPPPASPAGPELAIDSVPGALASGSLTLEEAVTLSQPAPVVSARELALAAPAAAPPPLHQPAQQQVIKPSTAATSSPASQRQALQDYVLQVVAKLSHTRFYAASPAARNGDGVVVARLTVARDGRLVDLSLPKQSGSAGIDSSVLEAIRQAAPFAPLPKAFADSRFTFIVPINYAPER